MKREDLQRPEAAFREFRCRWNNTLGAVYDGRGGFGVMKGRWKLILVAAVGEAALAWRRRAEARRHPMNAARKASGQTRPAKDRASNKREEI
jgi:hypothetical protein